MNTSGELRVLASGAYELWAGSVRQEHRLDTLGETALEIEKPLHLAAPMAERTVCGTPVADLREYTVDFSALDRSVRCPMCDEVADQSFGP